MGWVLLKTLASLAAVLGLMFVLVIVMKKYLFGFQAKRSTLVSVDILGQQLIQPKRSVVVLKVLNKIFIVGMTEEGMSTLGEIEDADILHWIDTNIMEAENGAAKASAKNGIGLPSGGAFADYLVRNMGFLRPKNRQGSVGDRRQETEEGN